MELAITVAIICLTILIGLGMYLIYRWASDWGREFVIEIRAIRKALSGETGVK